jgi:AcrR family transcriptional regulator
MKGRVNRLVERGACYSRRVPRSQPSATPDAAASDRRSQIVQAAYQLVVERGLEGLRFGDVARSVGINNGTLLYYFPTKQALIQAVGAYLRDQFADASWIANGDTLIEPLTRLRWEFVDARQRLGSDLGVVYMELLARAQRDPAVAQIIREIDLGWADWLSALLDFGRGTAAFRPNLDVRLVTTTIMACIRGVGMQALIDEDPRSLEPVMDAVAELIDAWVSFERRAPD